ncbi:aldehyde dehydrogenase family protein [Klebsiella pneumoniae]|uniref:hypothetical protein n=1 Tax=Klebsiella pneumoniae TaxID=573 RepID=UPI000E2BE457|nr:hypothetical protein [Klebsiella pneumoniae]SVL20831.1 aldehyde dehydrogenase [Klebsiella pneumoniae]HBR2663836.1 hypothetical protein [Klebsiella pneumoniae]HDG1085788.1 hypothetical protein [Klebsiella pneumoniae]
MSHARPGLTTCSQYDAALHALSAARQRWAETSVNRRLALLRQIKDALAGIAPAWVAAAAAAKGLPAGDPLAGEEWLAGPCALMVGCNGLIATLEQLEEKTFLRRIPLRTLADGRLALRVVPGTLWDRLLLSGVRAEIWMQPGVTRAHLDRYAARAYDIPPAARQGKLALVLGAGNVASIAPLDVLHKLFIENQVCLLKLNPVNDYLHDLLAQALAPLIAMDALRIVTGDARAGAWLTTHPAVDEIHITGSRETHDVIVWGEGETARQRRAAGTLRYGTVAINCWSGVAFLLAPCPWGAFPGHTLDDIQSGRGKVHNSFMLEKTERTVIEAPFRPFPRSLWHGELTLMPLPPWFITHRGQEAVAQRLVDFYHRPRWRKLPALLWRALRG